MRLLQKIKSLFGLDDGSQKQDRRGPGDITVEREPEEGPDRTPPVSASVSDTSTETDTPQADVEESEPTTDQTVGSGSEVQSVDETTRPDVTGESTSESETAPDVSETPTDAPIEEEPEPEPEPEPERAQESESKSEAEPPADEATESVTVITGIGPSYAERLAEAGVSTVADLAAADAETLAEGTNLSEKRISGWIEQAQQR